MERNTECMISESQTEEMNGQKNQECLNPVYYYVIVGTNLDKMWRGEQGMNPTLQQKLPAMAHLSCPMIRAFLATALRKKVFKIVKVGALPTTDFTVQ